MRYFLSPIMFWIIFTSCYVGLFSFASFFHQLLGHDISVLEQWLYHNRLFIITFSKLLAFFFILIFPRMYGSFSLKQSQRIKDHLKLWVLNWNREPKLWIFFLFFSLVFYWKIFNFFPTGHYITWTSLTIQVIECFLFWCADLVIIIKMQDELAPPRLAASPWLKTLTLSLLPIATTAMVSYSTWYDLVQLYILMIIIVSLLKQEKLTCVGIVTLAIFSFIFATMAPFNYLTNADDTLWVLEPQAFSLPWSVIIIVYVTLYKMTQKYWSTLLSYLSVLFSKKS